MGRGGATLIDTFERKCVHVYGEIFYKFLYFYYELQFINLSNEAPRSGRPATVGAVVQLQLIPPEKVHKTLIIYDVPSLGE